jgi:hypothetical protein
MYDDDDDDFIYAQDCCGSEERASTLLYGHPGSLIANSRETKSLSHIRNSVERREVPPQK